MRGRGSTQHGRGPVPSALRATSRRNDLSIAVTGYSFRKALFTRTCATWRSATARSRHGSCGVSVTIVARVGKVAIAAPSRRVRLFPPCRENRLESGIHELGTSLAKDDCKQRDWLLDPFASRSPAQTLHAAVSERLA